MSDKLMPFGQAGVTQILDAAVTKWGSTTQFLMLSGECGELIAAINRFVVQGRGDTADVIDEIADVHLLLLQASRMLGEEAVAERIDYKLRRLAQRVGVTAAAPGTDETVTVTPLEVAVSKHALDEVMCAIRALRQMPFWLRCREANRHVEHLDDCISRLGLDAAERMLTATGGTR